MVQLDALRAFAVFAVLFSHFYYRAVPGSLPLGFLGVRLFFVLSGFLITGILLKCRDLPGTSHGGLGQLRQFYIRRTLRIFPLFYLVVFVAAVADVHPVRETFLWLVTYTSNFYFALRGSWNGPINHLWSLAVEEQFYLFWPWLILFVADKYLLPCILTAIVLTPVYETIGFFCGWNDLALWVVTFACLDSLGIGALLAWYRYRKPDRFEQLAHQRAYNWVGLALLIATISIRLAFPSSFFLGMVNNLITTALFAWIIHKASVGFRGLVGGALETRPLLYCGKISYGIYVYHLFMPGLVVATCNRFHFSCPAQPAYQFIVLTSVTILIAACSWHFFEHPINNLKNRFRYSRP